MVACTGPAVASLERKVCFIHLCLEASIVEVARRIAHSAAGFVGNGKP